jgi:hypothetical protein
MFQFPSFPPSRLYIQRAVPGYLPQAGFPIRASPDQSLHTAPRGLSQCTTPFFGFWRQGIHRMPLVA